MEAVTLLINGAHGQYVPKVFAINYDLGLWSGIDEDEKATLLAGPDHPDYWEVWDDILGNASYTHGGNTWTLVQDSDVWAICPELMTNEEHERWMGSMKPVPDNAYELKVCGDCLIAEANADYTGMDDETIGRVQMGLDNLHDEYKYVSADGAEYGFVHLCCECCGALPGDRYRLVAFKDEVTA
jgi:hypothetical protein